MSGIEAYFSYTANIRNSGLSIYDPITIGDPQLWIPSENLEVLLVDALQRQSLQGLALRTRSKVVKALITEALGYPLPKSFKKTQPRFFGQNFDVYTQKSTNLQIWNEEISSSRRYAIIKVSANDIIETVRVIDGETLAKLDTTGTLTHKFQAQLTLGKSEAELICLTDTENIEAVISGRSTPIEIALNPTEQPTSQSLIPIREVFETLSTLLGTRFRDLGAVQERNRGAELHRLVCRALNYELYADDGRFPDIRNQLLEVKLQTSPTIDLGLVRPDSLNPLDITMVEGQQIKHSDVRYAIFSATLEKGEILLTHLFLTTGESFFKRFKIFEGKGLNKKLQVPLPSTFFSQSQKLDLSEN